MENIYEEIAYLSILFSLDS